jgi:hypothetical protein
MDNQMSRATCARLYGYPLIRAHAHARKPLIQRSGTRGTEGTPVENYTSEFFGSNEIALD